MANRVIALSEEEARTALMWAEHIRDREIYESGVPLTTEGEMLRKNLKHLLESEYGDVKQ